MAVRRVSPLQTGNELKRAPASPFPPHVDENDWNTGTCSLSPPLSRGRPCPLGCSRQLYVTLPGHFTHDRVSRFHQSFPQEAVGSRRPSSSPLHVSCPQRLPRAAHSTCSVPERTAKRRSPWLQGLCCPSPWEIFNAGRPSGWGQQWEGRLEAPLEARHVAQTPHRPLNGLHFPSVDA